jgi:uncharacterized protein (DUF3820 family)
MYPSAEVSSKCMRMPFGRYQDEEISSIDTAYLTWVRATCEDISEELIDAIEEELELRYESLHEERPWKRY